MEVSRGPRAPRRHALRQVPIQDLARGGPNPALLQGIRDVGGSIVTVGEVVELATGGAQACPFDQGTRARSRREEWRER